MYKFMQLLELEDDSLQCSAQVASSRESCEPFLRRNACPLTPPLEKLPQHTLSPEYFLVRHPLPSGETKSKAYYQAEKSRKYRSHFLGRAVHT